MEVYDDVVLCCESKCVLSSPLYNRGVEFINGPSYFRLTDALNLLNEPKDLVFVAGITKMILRNYIGELFSHIINDMVKGY